MVSVKANLTEDVRYIVYSSKAKTNNFSSTAGEMQISVEDLKSVPAYYTFEYPNYSPETKDTNDVTEIVRGRLESITQEYNGHVSLDIVGRLSGGKSKVNGGKLVMTEDKGLVAKFDSLKLIEE